MSEFLEEDFGVFYYRSSLASVRLWFSRARCLGPPDAIRWTKGKCGSG